MTQSLEDQFAVALAHQLKSPTAALRAAAANLRRNLRGLLEDLSSMAGEGSSCGATAGFISRVVDDPAPSPHTGLLPEDRVRVIARRLCDAGIEGDMKPVASSLVRGGWDTWLEEIAPLLRGEPALALSLLETASRVRANLSAIETSLDRVGGLASALRMLARPVTGDTVDLRLHIDSTASLLREALPSGVSLTTRIDPVPAVRGRADLLNEVWSNLVTNAAQALGEKGSIVIEARAGGAAEACAVVSVTDDGPGIPSHVLPRIFEPFFTTRASDGGSGLGLALARRIVEKLGGEISVDSRPGRTCFQVVLPAAGAVQTAEG